MAGEHGPPHAQPDELLVDVAALVESGQSNQMSLAVATGGAVITGRLAAEAVWRQRVSDVLRGFRPLGRVRPPSSTPP
jgi:hemolysin III